ncbi:MAG: EF-hand domain-containing protein [Phycisphaerales bacterium]
MKTKWTILVVAGATLLFLSSQVLAQPWGGGAGRGRGTARGQGMGPRGAQSGLGAWCPLGAGQPGQGAWCPLGLGRLGTSGRLARRLGLTDDQVQKIRAVLDKARSETMASIKEVLTEEQARQFERMCDGFVQPGGRGGRMRGPAPQDGSDERVGRRFQPGMGQGAQMRPRGQRLSGQPAAGDRGAGRGQRFQGRTNRPDAGAVPPAGGRDTNPGQWRNRNAPGIEQMFDRADTDQDGMLTKEELRAFREKMGQGQ